MCQICTFLCQICTFLCQICTFLCQICTFFVSNLNLFVSNLHHLCQICTFCVKYAPFLLYNILNYILALAGGHYKYKTFALAPAGSCRPNLTQHKDVLELFYLNSTLNFEIPPVLIFQIEVYYDVDRLLTGLTAQQKGATARWYSNKTSLFWLIQSQQWFESFLN